MRLRNTPIQRKLMRVMLITCGSMLLMACAAFFIYEFVTYRNISKNELATLSKIVARNSTASLAFENKEDAQEILNALKAQKQEDRAILT